jgi:hypothetical protein
MVAMFRRLLLRATKKKREERKSIDEGYEALERLLTEVHKKIPREEEEEEEEEDESMEEVQKEMEDLDIREGSDEGEE